MATTASQPVTRGTAARSIQREKGIGVPSLLLLYVVLTVVAIMAAFPFYWMLIASTHRSATILTVPPPITPGGALVQNYNELLQGLPFWRNMLNSLLVACVSTTLVLFFCSLGGYAFAKF